MAAELQSQTAAPATLDDAPLQQSDFKDRFYRFFQDEVIIIQEQMSELETVAFIGGERQDAIDHCLAGISRLSNEVSQAAGFLPPYDQRTYSQVIKALSEELAEKRSKIAPRPKFAFKTSLKNSSAISLTDAAELAQQRLSVKKVTTYMSSTESSIAPTPSYPASPPPGEVGNAVKTSTTSTTSTTTTTTRDYNEEMANPSASLGALRKPSFSAAKMVSISSHSGLHIILPPAAANATSSGSLTKLNRCIVDMSVPTARGGSAFAGLAIKDIRKSLIIVGHVAGAAHITGVTDSVIVVAARQVRMHECRNVDIYLQCGSRPIIEDCEGVRFAPIPEQYAFHSEKTIQDMWDHVDDFKWLKAEHSPNWSIMPSEKRVSKEVWRDVVPGGPSTSVDDILKIVGVRL